MEYVLSPLQIGFAYRETYAFIANKKVEKNSGTSQLHIDAGVHVLFPSRLVMKKGRIFKLYAAIRLPGLSLHAAMKGSQHAKMTICSLLPAPPTACRLHSVPARPRMRTAEKQGYTVVSRLRHA